MRRILLFLVLVILAHGIWGQNAATIDSLLEKQQVSMSDVAWIMFGAANIIDENTSPTAAFVELQQRSKRYTRYRPGDAATLADLCLIGMIAFDVPGGIMFTITRAPRYAFRDARYRRIIPGGLNPQSKVSGANALRYTGRFIYYSDSGKPPRMQ